MNIFKCKVLAMYILSALFKDTRLGEDVVQFVESALISAINGFDSVFWNVRNASTLLFSSLINRVFGVNRSRDEISKKNRFKFLSYHRNKNSGKNSYFLKYARSNVLRQIPTTLSIFPSSHLRLYRTARVKKSTI